MGTLDLTYYTWDSEIDLGGEPAAFQGHFIINCDAGGFNAKVRMVNIKLGGVDEIIHHVDAAVIEVIEEEILEAAVNDDGAYYKRYAANDLPDEHEEQPTHGYNGSVNQ